MDFITKTPLGRHRFRTHLGDCGSTYKICSLLPIRSHDPLVSWRGLYLNRFVERTRDYLPPLSVIRDGRFTSNCWRSFSKALGTVISYEHWIDNELRWIGTKADGSSKLETELELPPRVEQSFNLHISIVSNLKKCYADEPLVMPLEGIHVDDKLQFVEEPVEIMEREIKRLKRSRIPLVRLRSGSSMAGPDRSPGNREGFIGMPSLPFGMIQGTKPEPLKIAKTGQRARLYAGRDPDGELIHSRVPIADPHLLRDTHCWWGIRVKMMMRLFRSDDKFSQMLSQFESSTEFGGASGSGRCGDDEPGGDEDGDEDDEDEEDGDS
ncbi:hypothetical protein Tco_0439317 [Tanacetum coccineum]